MFNFKKVITTSFISLFIYPVYCNTLSAQSAEQVEKAAQQIPQNNSRFKKLKDVLFEQPYTNLPRYKVTKSLFNGKGDDRKNHLLEDAKRTLSSDSDLLAKDRGQKLLQANGICFSGQWNINKDSEFSGLFSKGSSSPVIARASVSFSGTKQKERRALGIALKLLPLDLGDRASLNVVTLHSVGGLKTPHLYDLSTDNEPSLGRIPRFRDIATALKLKSTFLKADEEAGSIEPSVTYRSVASVAAYNSTHLGSDIVAPKWLRLSPASSVRVDKDDFRDELRVENYPNQELVYNIEVAAAKVNHKSKADFQTIGELVLNASVTSRACDVRLHFSHPKN